MSNELLCLRDKLSQVYASEWASENHPQYDGLLSKFVFHMTDAVPEICKLASLLHSPETIDIGELRELLRLFFEHAVPHLVAAGQLYSHVPEVFPEQRGVHAILGANGENLLRNDAEPPSGTASSAQASSTAPSGR
jgi:hypothetical protein